MTTSIDVIANCVSPTLLVKAVELTPPTHSPSKLGWKAKDALEIVDALERSGVIILGGDAWRLEPSGKVAPAYANWYHGGEEASRERRVTNAAMKAREFIAAVILPAPAVAVFEMVCGGPDLRRTNN